ncbi:MAG: right-handed parallel beta-helix repeat-containing protein [Hyphomicrobiaceae bacterium]
MPTVTYQITGQQPIVLDIPAEMTPDAQTATIQAALDTVADSGGGSVTLSAGTVTVTGTGVAADGALRVGSNTTFEGAGLGETVLRLADGSNAVTGIVRTDSGQTLPDGSYKTTENVTIRNLSVDGNQANTTGNVDGFYSGSRPDSGLRDTNITLNSVEIHSVSRYGFDPHEGTTNLKIVNSIAHHNGVDGFTIDGSERVLLSNNVAYENGRHGINIVTGSRDVVVDNNTSYANGSSGLVVQTGDNEIRSWSGDITISGGSYSDNARYGLEIKHADTVAIGDVTASGNTYHGMLLSGVVGAQLSNNTMAGNNGQGSQLGIKNYVQDWNDAAAENDRVIISTDIIVDGARQETPANDLDVAVYDWVITAGDDVVTGTDVADTFAAGDGDDVVSGGSGNDRLAGNAGNDTLIGGPGDDHLSGNIGDDTLRYSSGYDRLDGGPGSDTADFSAAAAAIYVNLKLSGDQVLTSGQHTVSKSTAKTAIADLVDIETVVGSAMDDKIYGSKGSDILFGGDGADLIKGRSGQDDLNGGNGNDKLRGNGASDRLDGGSGNDDLRGGGGNDVLIGGAGNDTLVGGSGSDVFQFFGNWGVDRITDFRAGQDTLAFYPSAGPTSIADLSISDQGGNTVVEYGDQQITLTNLQSSSLSSDDFVFIPDLM